jgi:hypothetical protein
METVKLYRYEGATHYKGGCYPPYDNRNTEWSDNKQQQIDLFNTAKVEHFKDSNSGGDDCQIEEIKYNNTISVLKKEFMFFWCMLHEIEVPLEAWEKAKKTDDYEELPYLVDFNYNEIAERGIYINGLNMSEKAFDSVVYEPYKESNTEKKTGVFKPENIRYGKIK